MSLIKSGQLASQGQKGTRSVALDRILKAHVMSTISQRILRSQMPGYWAVEVRQSEAAGPGKRYLCQAQDDRSAAAIAGRLMGSAITVLGFNYYWIDKARLEQSRSTLPPLGEHQDVAGAAEWAALMAAHAAAELAAPERGGA